MVTKVRSESLRLKFQLIVCILYKNIFILWRRRIFLFLLSDTTDCRKSVVFGIYFYIYCHNFQFLYQDGHVQHKPTFSVFVPARVRPATKTEIIIVTIIVKVNSKGDTFSTIDCKNQVVFH